jgi:hypothetical protein
VSRFESQGFVRDVQVEKALHGKYDAYLEKRSRARKAFFVFAKNARYARRDAVVRRISQKTG